MANIEELVVIEKIREVYTFMINVSKQRADIVHFFSNKWTSEEFFTTTNQQSKERTVDNYIKRVKESFFNFENDVEVEKGRTLARLEDLYQKNIKIQDFKAAKDVLKEICLILGMYAKTEHKIETTATTQILVVDQETKDNLEKLNDKDD